MGTDTDIMLKALPVLLKARIVIAIIANARKAMFIVEDMEKEDMVSILLRLSRNQFWYSLKKNSHYLATVISTMY